MPERRVSASPRRRRDAAATREAILEAATRRFATQGYERAGVREIAGDAGVTAALVNRYFGSKEGLFARVIERALDMRHLLSGREANLVDHLARVMVYGNKDTGDRGHTPLMLLLHSAADPGSLDLFRQDLDRNVLPAPRRPDRRRGRRDPGRHDPGTAHGVRDHAPGAPPRGVRGGPWREAGDPPL